MTFNHKIKMMYKSCSIVFKYSAICLVAISFLAHFQSCKEKKQEVAAKTTAEVQEDGDGFVSIFDSKTLSDWKGDPSYWRLENGNLVGEVMPQTLLKRNTFIIWQGGQPEDFELKLDFKITESGNSGVNYRSDLIDTIPNALRGYLDDRYM